MTALFTQALLIAAVFLVFYLVLVRPQQQRLKRHREILASLHPGMEVATIGGIVGTIVSIDGADRLTLKVADGVTVTILRKSVDTLADATAALPSSPNLSGKECIAA